MEKFTVGVDADFKGKRMGCFTDVGLKKDIGHQRNIRNAEYRDMTPTTSNFCWVVGAI